LLFKIDVTLQNLVCTLKSRLLLTGILVYLNCHHQDTTPGHSRMCHGQSVTADTVTVFGFKKIQRIFLWAYYPRETVPCSHGTYCQRRTFNRLHT